MRHMALRLVGLAVAAVVLAVAAQCLTRAVADAPLLDEDNTDSTVAWLGRTHGEGVEILVGLGLVVLGLWLAYAFVTTMRSTRRVLHVPTAGTGRTTMDRRALARSIERAVNTSPREPQVSVGVTGRGRVDATVSTSATDGETDGEAARRVRATIGRIIEDRGLPCRAGRVRMRRSRHAIQTRVE
jgi:hypothetical protein